MRDVDVLPLVSHSVFFLYHFFVGHKRLRFPAVDVEVAVPVGSAWRHALKGKLRLLDRSLEFHEEAILDVEH